MPIKDLTDEEQLRKLALGDHGAFKALFLLYFPKVKYFIAHLVKSETIAEELAQDVFTKIWSAREKLNHVQSFNSFVYRMAKNAAFNHLDHQYVEEVYLQNYKGMTENTIEEELYAREIESLIQLTVDQLSPQRKRIYEMSRMEGLKNEEIATLLNLSRKTVENHLNLALKEIKKTISLFCMLFL